MSFIFYPQYIFEGSNTSHYSDINHDEFFKATVRLLQQNLPAELRQFKSSRPPQSCWIIVKYPRFECSQYELHLSSHSGHHASYFGPGPYIVCAFYYRTNLGDSDAWLEALAPHIEHIQEQLNRLMVIGLWSENWVWIAQNVDEETLTPENMSALFAQFIQATYKPITLAFKAIGR